MAYNIVLYVITMCTNQEDERNREFLRKGMSCYMDPNFSRMNESNINHY